MSTHVLAQFEGDKEQFPAYPLRKSTNRIAASKEHSSMHCLLTWNPDGCSVPNCKLDPLGQPSKLTRVRFNIVPRAEVVTGTCWHKKHNSCFII